MYLNRIVHYTTMRKKGDAIKSLRIDGYRVYKIEKITHDKVAIKASKLKNEK